MNASTRLTRAQLRELESELTRDRARLEHTLAAEAPSALDGSALAGVGMSASASPDAAIAVMAETRAHARYAAVVAALEQIRAGTYGTCAGCGQPIPYGRLLVMPEAAHCVRCGGGA